MKKKIFLFLFLIHTVFLQGIVWENYVERVAENIYQFEDGLKSIHFDNNDTYDINDILINGDTWAKIETNDCTEITFDSGVYINVGDTASYVEVNTDNCILTNVWIKGIGTTASAITKSFFLNAYNVRFYNCKVTDRYSNTNYVVFQGSVTHEINHTSRWENCITSENKSTTQIDIFKDCRNIINSTITDIDSNGGIKIFNNCQNLINNTILRINGVNEVFVYYICFRVTNDVIYDVQSTNGTCWGGWTVYQFSNVHLCYIRAVGGNCYGFYYGDGFSNCYIDSIYSYGNYSVYGFSAIELISSCLVKYAFAYGNGAVICYDWMYQVSSCLVLNCGTMGDGSIFGFRNIWLISSSSVRDIFDHGGGIYRYNNIHGIAACDN